MPKFHWRRDGLLNQANVTLVAEFGILNFNQSAFGLRWRIQQGLLNRTWQSEQTSSSAPEQYEDKNNGSQGRPELVLRSNNTQHG